MATYTELRDLYDNDTLRRRIEVALLVAAQGLLDGATPTAQQRSWARAVLDHPQREADVVLKYLLAKNKALTSAQIAAVTDASLQSAVDGVVTQLVSAAAGA